MRWIDVTHITNLSEHSHALDDHMMTTMTLAAKRPSWDVVISCGAKVLQQIAELGMNQFSAAGGLCYVLRWSNMVNSLTPIIWYGVQNSIIWSKMQPRKLHQKQLSIKFSISYHKQAWIAWIVPVQILVPPQIAMSPVQALQLGTGWEQCGDPFRGEAVSGPGAVGTDGRTGELRWAIPTSKWCKGEPRVCEDCY